MQKNFRITTLPNGASSITEYPPVSPSYSKRDRRHIPDFRTISDEAVIAHLTRYGEDLKICMKTRDNVTDAMLEAALGGYGNGIRFVPHARRTEAMCNIAAKHQCDAAHVRIGEVASGRHDH